jgi:hypothetical protein
LLGHHQSGRSKELIALTRQIAQTDQDFFLAAQIPSSVIRQAGYSADRQTFLLDLPKLGRYKWVNYSMLRRASHGR